MKYQASHISQILGVTLRGEDRWVSHIAIDSRKIRLASDTLFVAIQGHVTDGHQYVKDAYDQGVRTFLVSKKLELAADATVIHVEHTVDALQDWASYHRAQFNIPVIAITGSNGKTIVKEWLSQLASNTYHVVKSPRSYNSQIGVPLSVLQIETNHSLAIFEAGISQRGEMARLAKVIQPSIGIFTVLGDAHDENFKDSAEKLREKAQLFSNCDAIIYNENQDEIREYLQQHFSKEKLVGFKYQQQSDSIDIEYNLEKYQVKLPSSDKATASNISTCIAALRYINIEIDDQIGLQVQQLQPLAMRSEIIQGKWNSTIINDAYTADLQSISNIIDTIQLQGISQPIIILSDLDDNIDANQLYPSIEKILQSIDYQLITIGKESKILGELVGDKHLSHFDTTREVLPFLDQKLIAGRTIVLKGARRFRFEQIAQQLSLNVHNAVLEIDISAIEHNLTVYASMIQSKTKIMAVMKASAYGSGIQLLADSIASKRIDYMAVANIEEGILLRQSGIKLPIMIFGADLNRLDIIAEYQLEPVIYALYQLDQISDISREINIHIKLDTGMNRLGFQAKDIDSLINRLQKGFDDRIASIFSHLSGSDDRTMDTFSDQQIQKYNSWADKICKDLSINPIRHLSNTHAIGQHASAELDMVRLGIGLYGIDQRKEIQDQLIKAQSLFGKVIQIKQVHAGERIGYNGQLLQENKLIAIVNIGYADGIPRMAGNGQHHVMIRNQRFPTIGNICMDLTMIDITSSEEVGIRDKVEFFGKNIGIESLAKVSNTIPYEILTSIAPRINKIYTSQ